MHEREDGRMEGEWEGNGTNSILAASASASTRVAYFHQGASPVRKSVSVQGLSVTLPSACST
jgi:hypothetical protein